VEVNVESAHDTQTQEVICAVYSAAMEPCLWTNALRLVCDNVGAQTGFIAGLDVRSGRGAYWYAYGHDLKIQEEYDRLYVGQDPTLQEIMRESGKAKFFTRGDFNSNPAFVPFYENFLKPNGIRSVLSALICQRGSLFCFCGFQRSLDEKDFAPCDAEELQHLLPHFAKADQISAALSQLDESRKIAMLALDKIEHGIVFIDERRNIRLTNRRAEIMLESANIIQAKLGRLFISSVEQDIEFWRKVGLMELSDAFLSYRLGSMGRHAGASTITILPVNLVDRGNISNSQLEWLIFISDEEVLQNGVRLFASANGLTVAETRVLCGLANGDRPEDLCRTLSISMATLKTHIQRIYQKTGFNRQSELVRACFGYLPIADFQR
jgi:DNA-binding CsgD family transcriptional regulator